jgi:flagellar basal body P-ring formation protein FlgA
VQRDQNVTLIFETDGIYLTIRGKALDGGAEGDIVNVINLQSKRTVSGVVIGRGQVSVSIATPRLPAGTDAGPTLGAAEPAAPVSLAANGRSPTGSKPE